MPPGGHCGDRRRFPAQAANNSAVGSAVVGTALGAAAGAALGSIGGAVGAGAAVGGATGLLAGSAIGAGNAQASGAAVQQRYDMTYTQCMVSKGDTVHRRRTPTPVAIREATPAVIRGLCRPGLCLSAALRLPYGPYHYGPDVAIGIGGGWGWGHGWGDRGGWGGHWR